MAATRGTTIDLYGMGSPNVYKVAIMLEEVALPYRMHYVDVFAGQQFDPGFMAISPTARVPAIVDPATDSGEPLALCESGAILIYLAEKTARLLPDTPGARSSTMQWLMVQMGSVGPLFGQFMHFQFFARDNTYGRERYQAQARHLLALLDRRLGDTEFLDGMAYSIADIATFPWVRRGLEAFPWLKPTGIEALADQHPHLARWYRSIAGRCAVKSAIDRMAPWLEKTAASAKSATPEDLDRFLLRNGQAKPG